MILNAMAWALGMILCTVCTMAPVPDPGGPPVFAAVADRSLQAELESYLSELEGVYGVAARDLEDGRTVLINSDVSIPTASLYKLLVMYRVFQEIDRGRLSMEDTLTITEEDAVEATEEDADLMPGGSVTVAQALEAMVTVSSNSAAYALARATGGWWPVAVAARELGMDDTTLVGTFTTTPADVLHFFELLADGTLVSEEASEQMTFLLLRQQINNRIPALLPAGTPIAHKTGDLEDVRNDAGIVFGPGGHYIVVLMAYGADPDEAVAAEAAISRAVYRRYGE